MTASSFVRPPGDRRHSLDYSFARRSRHMLRPRAQPTRRGNEMICPNCKAEYRPGFTRCADCLVPLVDALPEPELGTPKRHKSSKEPLGRLELVTVLRAGDAGLAMLAESLLQSADIRSLLPAASATPSQAGVGFRAKAVRGDHGQSCGCRTGAVASGRPRRIRPAGRHGSG